MTRRHCEVTAVRKDYAVEDFLLSAEDKRVQSLSARCCIDQREVTNHCRRVPKEKLAALPQRIGIVVKNVYSTFPRMKDPITVYIAVMARTTSNFLKISPACPNHAFPQRMLF